MQTPPAVSAAAVTFALAKLQASARLRRRTRQEAFALGPLAGQLTRAAHSFGGFARPLLGRLFIMIATLHFTESAFPLHLLLQRLQRLIDVVVAHENLNQDPSSDWSMK